MEYRQIVQTDAVDYANIMDGPCGRQFQKKNTKKMTHERRGREKHTQYTHISQYIAHTTEI